jgi:hypothetical protein
VKNKRALWNLHLVATEYHSRPSAIVGLEDEWAAYQLDAACLRLARHVDEELEKKRSLRSILDTPADENGARREFADIRQLGPMRTMRIPDSGVW